MPIVTAPSEVIRSLSVPVVANVSVPLLDFCASRITPASLSVNFGMLIFLDQSHILKSCLLSVSSSCAMKRSLWCALIYTNFTTRSIRSLSVVLVLNTNALALDA